jgi:hypothetical protein
VKSHLLAAATLAAISVAAALLAGPASRPALAGADVESGTALASLWAYGRNGRATRRPVQQALLVFVVTFLVRIVLVGVALAVLVRAGESVVPFVIAFFVPYFAFTAIEGSLLISIDRGIGKTA